MTDRVIEELKKEDQTEFHKKLLTKCLDLVSSSRSEMSKFYDTWDEQSRIYDATYKTDKKDRRDQNDKEPAKMMVGLTASQVDTFIALMFLLLGQKKRVFELEPTGAEDYELREVMEEILQSDVKHNKFFTLMYQWLLDLGRFGVGIWKHGWVEEMLPVLVQAVKDVAGQEVEDGEEAYELVRSYVGNRLTVVSPYRFFPDCRLPLTRFQEGEFCASEDEHSKVSLLAMEANKEVAGIKHVEAFNASSISKRGLTRFSSINVNDPSKTANMYCVTEVMIKLVPSEFEMDDGNKLGTENFPIQYLVWYANDSRVIKVEPAGYLHGQFNVDLAQLSPDQHKQLNQSLSQQCEKIQEAYDWFINSRVSSVKRTLENNMVVDPTGVDMTSVESRSPIIKLRQRVGQGTIDRYVKQLDVRDVTAGHVNDAQQLADMLKMVTGITDQALGQYSKGRRDATQSRAVNQGAASRPVTSAVILFEQAIMPMAQKLVLNSRANLDEEGYVKKVGESKLSLFPQFKSTPRDLVGSEDFFVFDGVLPSEKQFLAQSMQELFIAMLQVPGLAENMGYDLKKMLTEIYELRGVTNLERFELSPEEQLTRLLTQQIQAQPNGNGNGQVPAEAAGQRI